MLKKFLHKIRWLIDLILDESLGEKVPQQKIVTVEGNVNITIIGDKNTSNLIIPDTKSNVKHFPPRKS